MKFNIQHSTFKISREVQNSTFKIQNSKFLTKFRIILCCFFSFFLSLGYAQSIPQHISYTRIYDFLDELANDGFFELNSVVKPYSRKFITDKLLEAQAQENNLNRRQRQELAFFLNDYALEQNKLPEAWLGAAWNFFDDKGITHRTQVSVMQPGIFYNDTNFRARITPILGMHILANGKGNMTNRWFGAEFQGMIGKNLSIWGSLRDISMKSFEGDLLAQSARRPYIYFLVNVPGYELKEATYGGDFSDSRGGIAYSWNLGSIAFQKDNIVWGDNHNGSNIISGRAPSFPMISLNLKPARWFEFNYIHAWLVSNVVDSTYYYVERETNKHYRPANKYMAANMLTFMPIKNLNISLGNAIVYSERNVQAAYFTPFAFYKSIDHTLTKGLGVENQNSAMFFNISSRNIKHLHLYTSVFIDEFNFKRLKPDNKESNLISYKIGANLTNFPVQNLSLIGEFTNTNILNYKHSISTLTWTSNAYNMGHYLGDNSQEIYLALRYKPIRGLDFSLSFVDAKKGKEFEYIRKGTDNNTPPLSGTSSLIITYPSLGAIIWRNQTVGFKTVYEVFNNAYAIVNVEYNHARGYENNDSPLFAEKKMSAQEALDFYTPKFLQSKNTTVTLGFSFGF